MDLLHARLKSSRGAAATVCVLTDWSVEACGVGNVELRCDETDIPFVFSPGILGVRVQRLRVCSARAVPGSRLIFFSDGLQPVSRLDDWRKLAPQDACAAIMRKHRRSEDDATVLVADLG